MSETLCIYTTSRCPCFYQIFHRTRIGTKKKRKKRRKTRWWKFNPPRISKQNTKNIAGKEIYNIKNKTLKISRWCEEEKKRDQLITIHSPWHIQHLVNVCQKTVSKNWWKYGTSIRYFRYVMTWTLPQKKKRQLQVACEIGEPVKIKITNWQYQSWKISKKVSPRIQW